jgi:hypothetical protein
MSLPRFASCSWRKLAKGPLDMPDFILQYLKLFLMLKESTQTPGMYIFRPARPSIIPQFSKAIASLIRMNMTNPTYPTDKSALILVDVLNDFLSPEGKINPGIREQIKKVNLIENLGRLITGARKKGLQIVYAPHGLHEHSFDDMKYVPVRMQRAMEHHMFWGGNLAPTSSSRSVRKKATSSSDDIVRSTHSWGLTWTPSSRIGALKRSFWPA